jgi:hypothetical protein
MNPKAKTIFDSIVCKIRELDALATELRHLPADELYNLPGCIDESGYITYGKALENIAQNLTESYISGSVSRRVMEAKECWIFRQQHRNYLDSMISNPWGAFPAIAFSEDEAKLKLKELESKEHGCGVGSGKRKVKYNYNVFYFKDGTTTLVDITGWRTL